MYLYGAAVIVTGILLIACVTAFIMAYRRYYITVRPDEYVVHYGKGGNVKHFGRGVSFVCWPWETYLTVPSTIRDINFCADQITKEKQGVRVQGFLAYRIEDFERAYQTLDLRSRTARILLSAEKNVENSDYTTKNRETIFKLDPNDPLAKTDLILRRLAESVVRHEVSNKTVDEMISEREAVVESMKEEIAPTVARWGLVVETIEFTEVWIRSKMLFENLQADYRNQMRFEAERSTCETNKNIAQQQLESEREVARLAAETERRRRVVASAEQMAAREVEIQNEETVRRQELEKERKLAAQRLENEKRLELLAREKEFERARREEELRQQNMLIEKQHELEQQQEEHKIAVDERLKVEELRKKEAETERLIAEMRKKAEIEQAELERQRLSVALQQSMEAEKQALEVKRLSSEIEAQNRLQAAQAEKEAVLLEAQALEKKGEVEAVNERLMVQARNEVDNRQLQALFIEQLSAIAANMKVDEVNWVNFGGASEGRSPLGIIPENIAQLLGIFKGMGVDLAAVLPGGKSRGKGVEPAGGRQDGRAQV